MKIPFVRRKTYEILQANCKILNHQRMKVEAENKKLQRKIKELEAQLKNNEELEATFTAEGLEINKKPRSRKTTKKEAK